MITAALLTVALASLSPSAGATVLADAPVVEARPTAIDMRVAALLMSRQQGGPLPMAIHVSRQVQGDDLTTVLRIELDGQGLTEGVPADGDAETDDRTAEIFVYVIGDRLEVLHSTTLAVPLADDDGPLLGATGVRAVVSLPSLDVATEARALARIGDRFGLRAVTLPATPSTPGSARLFEPRFDATEPWLVAVPRGQASSEDGTAALPVLAVGTRVRPTFDHRGVQAVDAVALQLEAVAADTDTSLDDNPTFRLDEPVPNLAPGRYRARLLVPGEPVEPSAAVDVLVVDGAAYAVPWPRLARLGQAMAAPNDGDDVLLPDDLRDALDVLERSWLETLASLPETGFTTGAEAMRRLEDDARRLFGPQGLRALRRMRADTFDTLERRLRRQPVGRKALLPVLALDLELERLHSEARRHSLARRAMDDALVVARRLAASADRSDTVTLRHATAALGWVGDQLQRRGFVDLAEALFREALVLDDADQALRFALAANLARHGQPAAAADEMAPLDAEAVGLSSRELDLRRAIVERRSERWLAAERSLRALIAATEDDWITTLAYQEMAVLHLQRRRPQAAEEVARRGLQRLGEDFGLRVLVARSLARRDRFTAAREVLAKVAVAAEHDNPRTRINAWPTEILATRRQALMTAATAHAHALAAVARDLLEDD